LIDVKPRLVALVARVERVRRRCWAYDPAVQAALEGILQPGALESPRATRKPEILGVTPRTLRNRFKRCTGLNRSSLQRKVNVVRSLEILADDPHVNLEWLANRAGYTRLSTLICAWNDEAGTTPGFAARVLKRGELDSRSPERVMEAAKLVDEARSRGGGGPDPSDAP